MHQSENDNMLHMSAWLISVNELIHTGEPKECPTSCANVMVETRRGIRRPKLSSEIKPVFRVLYTVVPV